MHICLKAMTNLKALTVGIRGNNVSHVVVLRPLKAGYFNFSSAELSYLPSETATEPQVKRLVVHKRKRKPVKRCIFFSNLLHKLRICSNWAVLCFGEFHCPSVRWHCWLDDRMGIRPVRKKLGVGLFVVTILLELSMSYIQLALPPPSS